MEQQLKNIKTASDWLCVSAQNVVLFLDKAEAEFELEGIRNLARENARLELQLKNNHEALDRVRERLTRLPDLDIDREYDRVLSEVNAKRSPMDKSTQELTEQYARLEMEICRAKKDREMEEGHRQEHPGQDDDSEEVVVNKKCGHKYNKAWILHQLEKTGRVG